MNKLLLSPVFVEMLKSMENVFRDFGIDYYLVGAVARDIHLSADIEAEALRKTEDIDIAITTSDQSDYLQLVCSRVIGRKIKQLLEGSEQLSQRIEQILAKRPTAWWQAMLDGMKDNL